MSSKLGRILEQNSYDHQTASKDSKQLERILLDAVDKCTAAVSERKQKLRFAGGDQTDRDHLGGNVTSSNPGSGERKEKSEVSLMSADERPLVGCEDPNLVESGVSKVFRVGSARTNQAGRDFNIRYCDQETRGGGWTVGRNVLNIFWKYFSGIFPGHPEERNVRGGPGELHPRLAGLQARLRRPQRGVLVRQRLPALSDQQSQHEAQGGAGVLLRSDGLGRI